MKRLLSITLIILFCTACEKLLMDENPPNTPQGNFDILWQRVNEKYSFFNLKSIDWDSIRLWYEPMLHPEMSDEALFEILDSMLYDLRDGHVNLVSDFNLSRNWQWYLNHPVNFNYDVIERYYLGSDYRIAGGLQYTIIDSIGYIYYGSFSSGFSMEQLQEMTEYLQPTKGVIVDVRDNGGGSLNNAYALASVFATESKTVLYTFEKTGPGPNDFGNASAINNSPLAGANYRKPVALLLNRKAYSATNTFAAILSTYPQVQIIGDKSGGGGGVPVDYELPNGWRFRFSATATFTTDGYNIENGIPVDIAQNNDVVINASGTDQILEKALEVLK